jgi:uncharacterized protein
MRRAVLDTQVWLDWLVFGDSCIAPLRDAHAARRVEIVANGPCANELARVLAYDLGRHSLDAAARERCLAAFRALVVFVDDGRDIPALPRSRDPDDQKFLELAARAHADFLVTKDHALLELAARVPFRIVRPAELFADAAQP